MSGYIGTAPVPQATQTRDSFTATSGQTSFATGGYTPNFLDVYLNGVKLASADYTATNGSDVVLASGASTGDILEVVAYTAFDTANVTGATNFTVTGAFTSQGIDDNANAVALTIDSSENVLVGKTSSSTTTAGNELRAGGLAAFTRSGSYSLNLNRLASNGDIAVFQKDGTTVGSIAVDPSNIAIGSGDTGIYFNSGDDALIPVGTGGNLLTSRDNAIDLGRTSTRFKDAYIGGGIYLGGTGSANKLDDYEEGTWTPTLIAGSLTVNNTSTYTKIGRLVTCQVDITYPSQTNGNDADVFGLPFTSTNNVAEAGGAVFSNFNISNNLVGFTAKNNTRFRLQNGAGTSITLTNMSGKVLRATITYITSA